MYTFTLYIENIVTDEKLVEITTQALPTINAMDQGHLVLHIYFICVNVFPL